MILWLKDFLGVGSTYLTYYASLLVALFALGFTLYILRERIGARLRGFSIAVILILLVRLVLLDNPIVWNYYKEELGRDKFNIGSRQRDIVNHRAKLFSRDISYESLPYLVVGSSQTDFLFTDYADRNDDFGLLQIAAFGPIDYVLYRKEILSLKPETIILYISEFDLARLWWNRYYLAPDQGLSIISFYKIFRDSPYRERSLGVVKELLVGEIFPEIKYSFIFKGLLRRNTGRDEAYKEVRERMKRAKQIVFTGEPVEEVRFSFTFLEEFVLFCRREGIEVIILQGDYNPKYFLENQRKMRIMTTDLLGGLSAKYSHVTYIEAAKLYKFKEEDFHDFLHVKKEPARLFRERLFREHLNITNVKSLGDKGQ